jgi:hypothetical protein
MVLKVDAYTLRANRGGPIIAVVAEHKATNVIGALLV